MYFSESRSECDNYDFTSTVETADEEEEEAKRSRKKKKYSGFVTGTVCVSVRCVGCFFTMGGGEG